MAEAPITLAQTKLRATMIQATRTRALQVAMNHAKHQLRAKGFRVSQYSRRELVTHAEQYLADHREALLANAKAEVEQWRLQGFFGRRAAVQKITDL
jgi:hypothetical protein